MGGQSGLPLKKGVPEACSRVEPYALVSDNSFPDPKAVKDISVKFGFAFLNFFWPRPSFSITPSAWFSIIISALATSSRATFNPSSVFKSMDILFFPLLSAANLLLSSYCFLSIAS